MMAIFLIGACMRSAGGQKRAVQGNRTPGTAIELLGIPGLKQYCTTYKDMFISLSMATDVPELAIVVGALKSVAEPTRLRLLALLRHGELTVGELCQILGQSQPRVSRHLRLLAEAGFLDRFREHQCVYYRAPVSGARLEWLRELLRHTDDARPVLLRDAQRMNQVVAERAMAAEQQLSQLPDAIGSGDAHSQAAALLQEAIGPVEVG